MLHPGSLSSTVSLPGKGTSTCHWCPPVLLSICAGTHRRVGWQPLGHCCENCVLLILAAGSPCSNVEVVPKVPVHPTGPRTEGTESTGMLLLAPLPHPPPDPPGSVSALFPSVDPTEDRSQKEFALTRSEAVCPHPGPLTGPLRSPPLASEQELTQLTLRGCESLPACRGSPKGPGSTPHAPRPALHRTPSPPGTGPAPFISALSSPAQREQPNLRRS